MDLNYPAIIGYQVIDQVSEDFELVGVVTHALASHKQQYTVKFFVKSIPNFINAV